MKENNTGHGKVGFNILSRLRRLPKKNDMLSEVNFEKNVVGRKNTTS